MFVISGHAFGRLLGRICFCYIRSGNVSVISEHVLGDNVSLYRNMHWEVMCLLYQNMYLEML